METLNVGDKVVLYRARYDMRLRKMGKIAQIIKISKTRIRVRLHNSTIEQSHDKKGRLLDGSKLAESYWRIVGLYSDEMVQETIWQWVDAEDVPIGHDARLPLLYEKLCERLDDGAQITHQHMFETGVEHARQQSLLLLEQLVRQGRVFKDTKQYHRFNQYHLVKLGSGEQQRLFTYPEDLNEPSKK